MLKTEKQMDNVTHSPTLNTVLMVENTLKTGELMKIAELKRILPRKVMHQTLIQILDYLQMSGKIIIGTRGVQWIYAEPEHLRTLLKDSLEI